MRPLLACRLPALMLLGLFAGCDRGDNQVAPQASAIAQPTIAPEVACEKVCDRASRCGVEAAEELTKSRGDEVELINKLRKEASERATECRTSCVAGSTAEDAPALAEALACVEQTTCATFESCLAGARGADDATGKP